MSERAEDTPLQLELDGHVLVATLNRPDRLNALDAALIEQLRTLWSDHTRMRGIRCIVITGAGPGFCAGADMALLASDRTGVPERARDELAFLPGLQVSCPVIVAVNGVCAGGGLHFVADGDIVIASESASFIDPHVSVGQVSALEPLTLWLRAQPAAIMRMALLGTHERLTAEQALAAGLVSEVVAPEQLHARALELARTVAGNSPAAVAATRRAVRRFEDELLERALNEGWDAIRAHWSHPDSKEGPEAFVDKREPRWDSA